MDKKGNTDRKMVKACKVDWKKQRRKLGRGSTLFLEAGSGSAIRWKAGYGSGFCVKVGSKWNFVRLRFESPWSEAGSVFTLKLKVRPGSALKWKAGSASGPHTDPQPWKKRVTLEIETKGKERMDMEQTKHGQVSYLSQHNITFPKLFLIKTIKQLSQFSHSVLRNIIFM